MIDCHVHLLGNGSSGSGCALRIRKFSHKLLARFILKDLGMPIEALTGDLDRLYVSNLRRLIAESQLTRCVLLAHERVYLHDGSVVEGFGSFYVPNQYLIDVCKEYPEFLPGVSIHPARPDAIDELDACAAQGAKLLKLLPNCQNVDCSNERYRNFWERLAHYNLPFLAHTGGELSVPVFDAKFADPAYLRLPLECGVKVIAAHGATSSLLFDPNYINRLGEMLALYPNLYWDNSALNTPLRSRHYSALLKEPFLGRVIYGSDFPIPISPRWVRLRGMISRNDYNRICSLNNLFDRDIEIKRALGFPEESFARIEKLLSGGLN